MFKFYPLLRLSFFYQCMAAYYAPKSMLHLLLGWKAGYMSGALAVYLTAYSLYIAADVVRYSYRLCTRGYRYIKKRINARYTSQLNETLPPNTLVVRPNPYSNLTKIPPIELPGHYLQGKTNSIWAVLRYMYLELSINILPIKTRHWIATHIWGMGALYEYTGFAHEYKMDDLYHAASSPQDDGDNVLDQILAVLPKDSLNRMLARVDSKFRYNPLICVAILRNRPDLFKKLLMPLSPEQRMLHLLNRSHFRERGETILGEILGMPAFLGDFKVFWQAVRDLFTPDEYYQLLTRINFNGESILHKLSVSRRGGDVAFALRGLEQAQIINCLKMQCQHEISVLNNVFIRLHLNHFKSVLALLPDTAWKDVLHSSPSNSNMTIGEQLLVLAMSHKENGYDFHLEKGVSEVIVILEKNYGVKFPKIYMNLSESERKSSFKAIFDLYGQYGCRDKRVFVNAHGAIPERLLGEQVLLPKKYYTKAYHKKIRDVHPDKNKNTEKVSDAQKINEANNYFRRKIR